jgi:hypothetical protein
MQLILISLTVCLVSAAVLYTATAFTNRLQLSHIFALALIALALYGTILVIRPPYLLITNILILLVAVLVGSLFGMLIDNSMALVSFCVVAAMVDLISSQVGATATLSHAFQNGSSNLLQYLSLSFKVQESPRPIVGISDLIIMTAIYFALRRAGHVGLLAFAAPTVGVLLALAAGLIVGGIAALPFISATTFAFLAYTHKRIQRASSATRADFIAEEKQISS